MAKRKTQRALIEEEIQAILDEQQKTLDHLLVAQEQRLADLVSNMASREADLKIWLNLDFEAAFEGKQEDLKKHKPLTLPSDEDWQALLARLQKPPASDTNDTPA